MAFRLPKTKEMLRREAASWLARLQSGRDPEIEIRFMRWRDADPRHAAAFDRVRRSYEQAGLLKNSPRAASDSRAAAAPRPQWRRRPALAAAAIIVLVPVGAFLTRGSLPFAGSHVLMLMTNVGEIKRVKLADGSTVTLDTSTKLDVEIGRSRRNARLRYGRARFQIAAANGPFVIETAGSTVTAQQGVIDVEQLGPQGLVRVLAGAADVRGSNRQSSRLALAAGERVTVDPDGPELERAAPAAPDWTRGMLQFDGTPLADAVALANRYSEWKIILSGDFGPLRVTGGFRAGDTTGLAKALAAAFDLSLQKASDGSLILSRSGSRAPEKKRGG